MLNYIRTIDFRKLFLQLFIIYCFNNVNLILTLKNSNHIIVETLTTILIKNNTMSSISQTNKPIDPNLYKTLHFNQLTCRPSGAPTSKPTSPLSLNFSNYQTVLNTNLSTQEKECLALRFKHFSGLGNTTFNAEQKEVNDYLKSLSKGMYNPQLNGLQLLFCQMFINKKDLPVQFSNYSALSLNGKVEKLTDMIDRVNHRLLLNMSLIQESLKRDEKITEDLIGSDINELLGFLKTFPEGSIKEGSSLSKLQTALEMLLKCSKDKGKLFPILLQPLDQLHLVDTQTTQADLLTFSQNKLFILSNSVFLLCEGIKQYKKELDDNQNKIAKTLNEKSLKNIPTLKDSFLKFQDTTKKIETLLKTAHTLADLVSNPRLLAAEEKICSEGPHQTLKLLEEIREGQELFYSLYLEFIELLKNEQLHLLNVLKDSTKNKTFISAISDNLTVLGLKFDLFIKPPLSILRKTLPATTDLAVIDLKKTNSFLQSMKQEFPLVISLSCHLRWIDVFTISALNPLLKDALSKPSEKVSDLITSLFAFSNDINILRSNLNMSGAKGCLKDVHLITDNQEHLQKANATLSDPKIYHLDLLDKAMINREDYGYPLDFSSPLFLYHSLSLPLGGIDAIDKPLLSFFNQTIETATAYATNSMNVIKFLAEERDPLSTEMDTYKDQWFDFYQKTIDLLSTPLSSQDDVTTLSLSLKKHFNHPPYPSEDIADALENKLTQESKHENRAIQNAIADFYFLKTSVLSSLLRLETRTQTTLPSKEKKAIPKLVQIDVPEPEIQVDDVSKTSMETQSKLIESPLKAMSFMQLFQQLHSNLQSLESFKLYSGTGKEQEIILRNDRIEKSLGNLRHQLLTLQSLRSIPDVSYLQVEALQRANALLIESALNYIFAFSEVKDSQGKHVVVSDEVSRWQHQLMEMVRLIRNSGQTLPLSNQEELFLQNISSMLSKAVNPSHFPSDPRLTSLKKLQSSLETKKSEEILKIAALAAWKESASAIHICNHLLFNNLNSSYAALPLVNCELPKNFSAASHIKYQNTSLENVLTTYSQLEEHMQEEDHTIRVPGEPLLQHLFRTQLVSRNFQDIAFHLNIAKEGLAVLETKRATFPEVNALFLHLSLSVEKSMKIMTLMLPISSGNNNQTGQHALFEVVNNRPRRYDHHLVRNLSLLQSNLPDSLNLTLSNDSKQTIEEFAEYVGELSRYPSGRTGTIAKIMDELKTLNLLIDNACNASLSQKEEEILIQRCGKDSSTWIKTLKSQLQSLQFNELRPRAMFLLSTTDALLQHALRLIDR